MGAARRTRVAEAQYAAVPYQKPMRTWAGHGSGALCDLCRQPIEADQIEYELELPPGAQAAALNMHLACYEKWSAAAPRSM